MLLYSADHILHTSKYITYKLCYTLHTIYYNLWERVFGDPFADGGRATQEVALRAYLEALRI